MSGPLATKLKISQKYYGQLVIGPPGSGKTTYCWKMTELLKKLGRKVLLVNLDPANETLPYKPDIDVRNLINLDEVMQQSKLGPNGALLYCMEYLESNLDWLHQQLTGGENGMNIIFDLPGQVELYIHHKSLHNIVTAIQQSGEHQLCAVHLVDSHHCSDAGKFISALTVSLSAMLRMGLPHVNVLTKIDLLKQHEDKLEFGIDFYSEVLDLNYLLEALDTDVFTAKYRKLNKQLVSIIEDYSLVSFQLLNIHNEDSILKLKHVIDKASGYVFKAEEGRSINSMLACAMGAKAPAPQNLDEYL